MPVNYFFCPTQQNVEVQAYRKHASLRVKDLAAIQACIQVWLERCFMIEELLFLDASRAGLSNFPISSPTQAEGTVLELRDAWNLGIDAIENLTGLLEIRTLKSGRWTVSMTLTHVEREADNWQGRVECRLVRFGGKH